MVDVTTTSIMITPVFNAGSNPSCLPLAPCQPSDGLCRILSLPTHTYERNRSRIDEESCLRNATPTFIIGACTCLVVRPPPFSPASEPTSLVVRLPLY